MAAVVQLRCGAGQFLMRLQYTLQVPWAVLSLFDAPQGFRSNNMLLFSAQETTIIPYWYHDMSPPNCSLQLISLSPLPAPRPLSAGTKLHWPPSCTGALGCKASIDRMRPCERSFVTRTRGMLSFRKKLRFLFFEIPQSCKQLVDWQIDETLSRRWLSAHERARCRLACPFSSLLHTTPGQASFLVYLRWNSAPWLPRVVLHRTNPHDPHDPAITRPPVCSSPRWPHHHGLVPRRAERVGEQRCPPTYRSGLRKSIATGIPFMSLGRTQSFTNFTPFIWHTSCGQWKCWSAYGSVCVDTRPCPPGWHPTSIWVQAMTAPQASNISMQLIAMASNLLAMASNLRAATP